MWTSKTSLLLLLVLSFTFAVESYRIVKVDTENRVYLLLRGNCRPILEPTTWRSFGYSIGTGSESPCELQVCDVLLIRGPYCLYIRIFY